MSLHNFRPLVGSALGLCLACSGATPHARDGGDPPTTEDASEQLAPESPSPPRQAEETEPVDLPPAPAALLGARHDLSVTLPPTPTCRCLAARLFTAPTGDGLAWEEQPPRLQNHQQIVALSSKGVPCAGAGASSLGASYHGYEFDGADVVVFVEELREGRPSTQGAIIPKPGPRGRVFIEALGSPFGLPLNGRGRRCSLPGPGMEVATR